MSAKDLAAAALAVVAITGLALPASAEVSGYTVAPAGPVDSRNSYVPPVNAVFVVDNAKGANQHVLSRQQGQQGCGRLHPATKLPQ
jgi:hypothetical protein